MKNIFTEEVIKSTLQRIEKLSDKTQPKWGKMDVAQMLAHCNVTHEMAFENTHPKPNALVKLILKTFVKNGVVSEKPYKKSIQTAPQFLVKDEKDFEQEKARLINFIQKTKELGEDYFEGKVSHSFGPLTSVEWNNMFYKHLEHHLTQFGV